MSDEQQAPEQPTEQPAVLPTMDDNGRIRTPISPAVWEADRQPEAKAPSVPKRQKPKEGSTG